MKLFRSQFQYMSLVLTRENTLPKSVTELQNVKTLHKIGFGQTFPKVAAVPWDTLVNAEDPNVAGQEP